MGLKIENFTDDLTTVYHDKAHDLAGTQHDRQLARQCARSAI